MRRHRAGVAVLAVAVGLAACGDDDDTSGGAASDTDTALTATVQRSTLFETRGALRLSVRNTGSDEVEIGTVQLSSPLFEPVEPEARDALLDPGGRPVVLPLRLGPADCAGGDGSGDEDSSGEGSGDETQGDDPRGGAELIATVDGDERRIPLELEPSGLLAEMQGAECEAAAVVADVELRLGDEWTAAGPRALTGELLVSQRQAGVTAELDEVLGNVIFSLAADSEIPAGQPWLTVDDATTSAGVPVRIRAARCDPHALIEYKRTFIFVAVVAVDGADPVRVDVTAEDGARDALEDLLESCLE